MKKVKSYQTTLDSLEPGDLFSYTDPHDFGGWNVQCYVVTKPVPSTVATWDAAKGWKVWELLVIDACDDCGAEEGGGHGVACPQIAEVPADGWSEGQWEAWVEEQVATFRDAMREPDDD